MYVSDEAEILSVKENADCSLYYVHYVDCKFDSSSNSKSAAVCFYRGIVPVQSAAYCLKLTASRCAARPIYKL